MVVMMKISGSLKEIRRDLAWCDKLVPGLCWWYLFRKKQVEYLEESHRLKEPSKVEGTEANKEKIRQAYERNLSPEYRPKIHMK
jgi:hypothetical protein